MKSMKRIVLMSMIAIGLTTAASQAVVVGVDTTNLVYTGAGVLDTGSRLWHEADAGDFLLFGQTVSIDLDGAAGENSRGGGAIELFQQIRFKGGGNDNYTVTLSGLNDGLDYNVVVYGADRFLNRGTAYTVGGTTKSTTGNSTATFIEGTNYVRFNGVNSTSGDLTIDLTENTDGEDNTAPSNPATL